jgi:hypothetical protein
VQNLSIARVPPTPYYYSNPEIKSRTLPRKLTRELEYAGIFLMRQRDLDSKIKEQSKATYLA